MPHYCRRTLFSVGLGQIFGGDCAQDRAQQIYVDIERKRLMLQKRADPGDAGKQRDIADAHKYDLLDLFHGAHFLPAFVRFLSDNNNKIFCKNGKILLRSSK